MNYFDHVNDNRVTNICLQLDNIWVVNLIKFYNFSFLSNSTIKWKTQIMTLSTVRTVQKSDLNIIETEAKSILIAHIYVADLILQ